MSEITHQNDRSVVGRVTTRNGELQLAAIRAGQETHYELIFEGVFLMATYSAPSCRMLMDAVLDSVSSRRNVSLLIGGLGMGFTLARTLALVAERAVVEVAELVPEIVTWNQELFGHCAGDPLKDERTKLIMGDVREVIEDSVDTYDVIMLDVDNGPEGLSRPSNDSLYNKMGLKKLHKALRQDGVLGIWSASDHEKFNARLRAERFNVELRHVKARRTKGARRAIWTAKRI